MKNRNLDNHDNWATPRALYDALDSEFHFDFDPCPLVATFDGLSIPWGKCNFINPPYSRTLKEAFIRKALRETQGGAVCVLLLPVSTSTKIFHELIYQKPYAELRFLSGRVRFAGVNTKGERVSHKAGMHDSMLVIFRPV